MILHWELTFSIEHFGFKVAMFYKWQSFIMLGDALQWKTKRDGKKSSAFLNSFSLTIVWSFAIHVRHFDANIWVFFIFFT